MMKGLRRGDSGMKRSRAVAAAVAVFTITFLVGLFWLGSKVSPATFERVKIGMTMAEVEKIMGRPPDGVFICPNFTHVWTGPRGDICVHFNPDLVDWKMFDDAPVGSRSYPIHRQSFFAKMLDVVRG